MYTLDTINEAADTFLSACQKMIDDHYAGSLPNLTPPRLSIERNPRYWRVVSAQTHGRSVYCFLDPMTGDVLKAEGWKRPAIGARGNLFDNANGMRRMTVYGAGYNR